MACQLRGIHEKVVRNSSFGFVLCSDNFSVVINPGHFQKQTEAKDNRATKAAASVSAHFSAVPKSG